MRRLHTLGLMICGIAGAFAASGCKDDPAGPGVSDDTAWRIGCTRRGGTCTLAYDPHGGEEVAGDIKVRCRREEGGLSIRLEDPGTESGAMRGRNRSILEVNFIDTEENKCTVSVEEYPRGSGLQTFRDQCEANQNPGSCQITGKMNSDGFDFNGTIFCDAMQVNNAGARDFRLEDGENPGEPVPLQIVNCR